jgi:ParB family chromosome partitioning protein
MAGSGRGLGKGLDALFNPSQPQEQDASSQGIQELEANRIDPNPEQPRQSISQDSLDELAQSIAEQGLLQPLLVRPHPAQEGRYQIIAGERRWRACQLAGLQLVPALIRDLSDSQTLVFGLVENLQRQDLNPVEEARALDRLLRELDVSQDELARRIGRSRSAVANSLRLLHLQPAILSDLAEGRISSGQARTLLAVPDQEARMHLFEACIDKQLTVRQLEHAVSSWKATGCFPPPVGSKPGPRQDQSGFSPTRTALQQALTQRLEAGVQVKGERSKGRITLAYSSEDELRDLVRKLGVDPDTCFT